MHCVCEEGVVLYIGVHTTHSLCVLQTIDLPCIACERCRGEYRIVKCLVASHSVLCHKNVWITRIMLLARIVGLARIVRLPRVNCLLVARNDVDSDGPTLV